MSARLVGLAVGGVREGLLTTGLASGSAGCERGLGWALSSAGCSGALRVAFGGCSARVERPSAWLAGESEDAEAGEVDGGGE